MTMELRNLGGGGVKASALTLGTMTFGHGGDNLMGQVDGSGARAMVDAALEAGVNLFDTADAYSSGQSEEILGEALGDRRQEVLIATKVNGRMGPGPNDTGQSRKHVLEACEASLRRLKTDYIDLYQVHTIDETTPIEETLRALDDLVREGKVRYIGCSNYSAWHLMKALSVSERRGFERYVTHQGYYSLAARELEHELVPLCLDQRLGVLVWSPLAGGLLSGKQKRGEVPEKGTRRDWRGDTGTVDYHTAWATIDVLREIADQREVSVAQVSLNWLLRRPAVTSVIVGARTQQQLEDNLRAATWELTPEEVQRLDRVSARPLPYPIWHQNKMNPAQLVYRQQEPGQD